MVRVTSQTTAPTAVTVTATAATAATAARDQNFSVRPETFLVAGEFCFLNEGQHFTLSLQLAEVFLKIGCESGKFRVLLFSSLLVPCEIFDSFSPFGE